MKKDVLNKLRELEKNSIELNDLLKNNNDMLDVLKKDKKVLEYLKLLEDDKKLIISKKNLNNEKELIIKQNCDHPLVLYLGSELDRYDCIRYNEYKCIECGKVFETDKYIKNVIDSNISFKTLHREYFEYLLKYDEKYALEIMRYKYNSNLFKELIDCDIETKDALKLAKKYDAIKD